MSLTMRLFSNMGRDHNVANPPLSCVSLIAAAFPAVKPKSSESLWLTQSSAFYAVDDSVLLTGFAGASAAKTAAMPRWRVPLLRNCSALNELLQKKISIGVWLRAENAFIQVETAAFKSAALACALSTGAQRGVNQVQFLTRVSLIHSALLQFGAKLSSIVLSKYQRVV
jgi:hypothetical protein